MFRKILIASDLSDASREALRQGIALGRRFGSEVTVVHVTVPYYPANHWYVPHIGDDAAMLQAISEREQDAAKKMLEDSVREMAAGGEEDARVTTMLKEGVPADAVLEVAAEIGADLIVLGTHGRRGVERLVLGSVAERVGRKATCSVLTVHSGGGG